MVAFKRTPGGVGVRGGVRFPEGKTVLVENPTQAQLDEPSLWKMEVDGADDPRLSTHDVIDERGNALGSPDESGEAVAKIANERDELKARVEKLETDQKAAIEKAKTDHEALVKEHKDEIAKLKEAHKAELEAAKKPK